MAILFVFLAGLLASTSNFCMRKSIDAGGSSRAYLLVQLIFSFFLMIVLNPVRSGNYAWSTPAFVIGLFGGLIFGTMMWGLGKALETGPAGISFAFLNTASVLPAILMALFFGLSFGHHYTLPNAIGSLLVVGGLFWAGWSSEKNPNKAAWLFFALLILFVHALFLIFLQWWALLLKQPGLPSSSLLPFVIDPLKVQWFMPAVLLSGSLFQIAVYLTKERRFPKGAELTFGILGGIANGGCTFFLVLAPQVATPLENAMMFPIFAVSIIVICNGWAQLLYKEKVNWWANSFCILGLIIGTVAWSSLR